MRKCAVKKMKAKRGNRCDPQPSGGCACGCYGKDIKKVPFPYKGHPKMERKARKSQVQEGRRKLAKAKREFLRPEMIDLPPEVDF